MARVKFKTALAGYAALGLVIGAAVVEVAPGPDAFSGVVVGVHDGDTFQVATASGVERVRLWGVDAPELGQRSGWEAREYARGLIGNGCCRCEVKSKDRYGRKVCVVKTSDGGDLAERMTSAGWAWWYRAYAPRAGELKACEAAARSMRLGLWREEKPTPPWQYRGRRQR